MDSYKQLFQFLKEFHRLKAKPILDINQFEKTLWLSDIPKEKECFSIGHSQLAISPDKVNRAYSQDKRQGSSSSGQRPAPQSFPRKRESSHLFLDKEVLTWLKIKKPKREIPPEPSEKIKPWLKEGSWKNYKKEPQLFSYIISESSMFSYTDSQNESEDNKIFLKDQPQIKQAFTYYLKKWRLWAEEEHRLKPVQKTYNSLYDVYQKTQNQGEVYEIVLGIGFLQTKNKQEKPTKRHIATSPLSIRFDSKSGAITVGPPEEGVELSLEMDMLTESEKPKNSDEINNKLSELENDFWGKEESYNCLKSWIHNYNTDGQFSLDFKRPEPADFPILALSPAVILRKRNEKVWTNFYEPVIQDIDKNPKKDLPCLKNLVKKDHQTAHKDNHLENKKNYPSGGGDGGGAGGNGDSKVLGEKHYFPLLMNEEQKKIIKTIAYHNQALVQGPPGTGKSHAIANLICHFLSTGKRILITSQTDRALKVLKGKLPEELKPLCVEILGRDQSASQKLKESVEKINSEKQYFQEDEVRKKIKQMETKDDDFKGKLAHIQSQLFEIKQSETIEYKNKFGYSGKLAHIASQLKNKESQHQWIREEFDLNQRECPLSNNEARTHLKTIKDGESQHQWIREEFDLNQRECPISNNEAIELLKIIKNLKDMDEDILQEPLSFLNQALSPKGLSELIKSEKETLQTIHELKECEGVAKSSFFSNLEEEDFDQMYQMLNSLLSKARGLFNRNEAWVKQALTNCLADKDREWKYLHDLTNKTLNENKKLFEKEENENKNIKWSQNLFSKEVQSNPKLIDLHLTDLLKDFFDHYNKEDEINWGVFGPALVKKLKKIEINGKSISSYEDVEKLKNYVKAKQALDKLKAIWKNQGIETTTKGRNFIRNYHVFKDYMEPLEECIAIHKLTKNIKQILEPYKIPYPHWKDIEVISTEIMIMNFIKEQKKLKKIKKDFEKSLSFLKTQKDQKNQIAKKMILSIKKRNLKGYEKALHEVDLLKEKQKEFQRLTQIKDQLKNEALYEKIKKDMDLWEGRLKHFEEAWAWGKADKWLKEQTSKKLYEKIKGDMALWESRLKHFEEAWAWGQADRWLKGQTSEKHFKKLNQEKKELLEKIHKNMEKLVSKKSWSFCLSQITDQELSSLDGWMKSIKKIGKGTGKTAGKHRRVAKKRMEECKTAIPAWVMPLYRVAENIKPSSPAFDIAIIDEASQTGPDGFLLNYIAKKIIVVGDEEQISPENIGIKDEDFEILNKKYLSHIENSDYIGEYSYYDYCSNRYKSKVIQLREHFRCMPEIIQFSNRISYSGTPLWPLRQYGRDRLPPLKTTYVENAISQIGHSRDPQNKKEAEAVATQIQKCIEDPTYKGKTFGVIVLQGKAQIELIEKALLEIDRTEMEKRELRVGNAYDFQGDERDVIFLSMAIAKDWSKTPQTKESVKKRYNVASSRAKDQMWLFHSVEPHDLSKNDFRRQLLDHCMHDPEKITVWPQEELNKLHKKIKDTPNKSPDNAPEPFDSWFESRVFLKIAMKGYSVHPQQEEAGYKIDMVIAGGKSRLAVECDGDYWHEGEEKESRDMERQEQLERCGWTFWRLRESQFNRDEDLALESLWELLNKMGIDPLC